METIQRDDLLRLADGDAVWKVLEVRNVTVLLGHVDDPTTTLYRTVNALASDLRTGLWERVVGS